MDILGKLLGSVARVKIMRLFILNPQEVFEVKDIRIKSKVEGHVVRRELARLHSIGFIRRKSATKEVQRKYGGHIVARKKWVRGLSLEPQFPYLSALRTLLISSHSFERRSIISRFRGAGKIKLLIIAGVFIQNDHSRVDILIVGDSLNRRAVLNGLKALEAEIGKELSYAILKTEEFTYRTGIYDKFVRDILDYPHEKLINKLGLPRDIVYTVR